MFRYANLQIMHIGVVPSFLLHMHYFSLEMINKLQFFEMYLIFNTITVT